MSLRTQFFLFQLAMLFLLPLSLSASEVEIEGEVSVEGTWFVQESETNPAGTNFDGSATAQPSVLYEMNGGDDRFVGTLFFRRANDDPQRTHWDIRAASYLHQGEQYDLVLGIDSVFWGKTESVHLVDIINQTDSLEGVDGEAKLGQAMINLNMYNSWGTLSLFVLPDFRERELRGNGKRLAGVFPIFDNNITYDRDTSLTNPDVAVRYSHYLDNIDFAVSHFHGTSREARLLPDTAGFRQHYDLIDQTSLEIQYTTGAWLLKLEAISRSGHGKRFFASVAGFEYTKYSPFDSAIDIGLLLESQYDNRSLEAPFTTADDDIFAGVRVTLNDAQDTNLLLGAIKDPSNGTTLVSLEARTRLAENINIRVEGRFFINVSDNDPIKSINRDDHIIVKISWYF